MQRFAFDDRRPAEILHHVGNGATGQDAAARVGISRKTVTRWRERVAGFGKAYDRAAYLSRDDSAKAREELTLLVSAWMPGGLAHRGPEPEPAPAPEPPPEPLGDPMEREPEWVRERVQPVLEQAPEPPASTPTPEASPVVEPDVLDATGTEITVQGARPSPPAAPYTKVRPPTREEWLAEMAALAKDPKAPERVRVTAIAAVSSGLFGGPGGRSTRPADLDDVAVATAARERGRDPGVPASVWQEARRNFLGPAPATAADDSKRGDVVELEQAKPG